MSSPTDPSRSVLLPEPATSAAAPAPAAPTEPPVEPKDVAAEVREILELGSPSLEMLQKAQLRAELALALNELAPVRKARWPAAAAFAFCAVVAGVLASWPVASTPVRLDLVVSGLTLEPEPREPVWTQVSVREVGMGEVLTVNGEPSPSYFSLQSPDGGSIALESFAPMNSLKFSYAADGPSVIMSAITPDNLELALTIPPGTTGRATAAEDFQRLAVKVHSLMSVWIVPDHPGTCLLCVPIELRAMSFLDAARVHSSTDDLSRVVSTVEGGTITFDDLKREPRKVNPGDQVVLTFKPGSAHLRSIRALGGRLSVQLAGEVSDIRIGGGADPSAMPSTLEWLLAQHTLEMGWGGLLYLFSTLAGVLAWSGRKIL